LSYWIYWICIALLAVTGGFSLFMFQWNTGTLQLGLAALLHQGMRRRLLEEML
jgi:hypothetical protein